VTGGGAITRRAWLGALPGVALVPRLAGGGRAWLGGATAQAAPIPVSALHSVTLAVADVSRSLEFYRAVFGAPVLARNGPTVVLGLGSTRRFLALTPADGRGPRFASFSMAVRDFDLDAAVRALAAHGIEPTDATRPGPMQMRASRRGGTPELFFGDPHGMRVQLHGERYCAGSGPDGAECAVIEPARATDLSLVAISHFTNNAADPTRSVDFYRSVFGFGIQTYQAASPLLGVGTGGDEFLMFIPNSVGRTPEEAAREPGRVHHACFTVADFEVDRVLSALERHGIRAQADAGPGPLRHSVTMRMPDRGGAPGGTPELYFTDPDGLSIQLQDPSYCGGGGYLGDECG